MAEFNLTREEQETNLLTNAAANTWDFYTLDPKFVRRLTKLGYRLEKDPQGGWRCRVPLDRIKIQRPEKSRRGFASRKSRNEPTELHTNVISESDLPEVMVGAGGSDRGAEP